MPSEEYLRVTDAVALLGISRTKLWRLIRDGKISVYENPKDARVRLLKRSELEAVLAVRPKPVRVDTAK